MKVETDLMFTLLSRLLNQMSNCVLTRPANIATVIRRTGTDEILQILT